MAPVPITSREYQVKFSTYKYQTFYNLSEDTGYVNANGKWDLAFESSKNGWHVMLNYSNYIGILNTGSTDFTATSYATAGKKWFYDASSGNLDSTAVGDWRNPVVGNPEVYLVGKYDGVGYTPFQKIRFLQVTDSSYVFEYAAINNSNSKTETIKKDTTCNLTYYSLSSKSKVAVEPPKNKWDLLFTQYMTTLFTNEGVPTPYLVRGVYINSNQVSVMLDSITGYDNITIQSIIESKLRNLQDIIGYNWKSVEINQSSNTAVYAIRQKYSYIIKDNKGEFYKLRFLSFLNDSLLVGYPRFETKKL